MKNRNDKQIAKLRILNGGRGSGHTVRRIAAIYEEKIADLKANFDYVLEGRDLKIKKLEQQIEKMKCCENCKHKNLNWSFAPICEQKDGAKIENPLTCKCDKWEIKENE